MRRPEEIMREIADKRDKYFDDYRIFPNTVLISYLESDLLKRILYTNSLGFNAYSFNDIEKDKNSINRVLGMEIIETEEPEIVCFRRRTK